MIKDMKHEVENFLNTVSPLVDLNNVKTILDLGSRDADHGIVFSLLFPEAKVYSFECNPYCLELCKQNIKEYGNDRIILIEKAVFDQDTILNFYPVDMGKSPSKNYGSSSVFKINPDYWPWEPILQTPDPIQVEAIRLDNFLKSEGLDKVDIAWVDLQGSEYSALVGLGDYLKDVRAIQTEVEYKPQYLGQPLVHQVDNLLRENGFKFIKHNGISGGGWFSEFLYYNTKYTR